MRRHLLNIKTVDQTQIAKLIQTANESERKRTNFNLHPELDDPINRFFNVMLSGTYVRPHRHSADNRWELFVIVHGEAVVVCFDDKGILISRHILNPDTANVAIEIPANTWHSIAIIQDNTVLYESKPGPYLAVNDKDFAHWAPKENENNTQQFINWFIYGQIGSSPPKLELS